MKIDSNIANLICELEYKIGSQTCNPNSYNSEDCPFRYPVHYCKNKTDYYNDRFRRTSACIRGIAPECIETIKYKFGSNHLYIGDGIVDVLEYLENIYDIDFNQLEENRIIKQKEALKRIEERLNAGEVIRVKAGIKKVGLDIPDGCLTFIKIAEDFTSIIFSIYDADNNLVETIATQDNEINVVLKDGFYIDAYYEYDYKRTR